MGSSVNLQKGLGTPYEIDHTGYYRLVNGKIIEIVNEEDLLPTDVFVGNRNRDEYREKRKEKTGGKTNADTRVHDELKEETDKNPTPENHSESEE